MMDAVHEPKVGLFGALAEQVRAVGGALRREATAAAALVALLMVFLLVHMIRDPGGVDVDPAGSLIGAGAAFVFPFAVWKGDRLFGPGYLWTLPVDRSTHALVKAFAGWLWLMLTVAAFLGWLVAVALITGGNINAPTTHLLLQPGATPDSPRPGDLREVTRALPAWNWLAWFTAATVTYLLGTAAVLGLRRPLLWGAGVLLCLLTLGALGGGLVEGLVEAVLFSPIGLDYALSGGAEALEVVVTIPGQEESRVAWRALPSAGRWSSVTALWAAIGLAFVAVAAARHREG